MRDGVPTGGIPIPDLASFLTGFHADTRIVGLDTRPAARSAAGHHRPLGVRRDAGVGQRAGAAVGLVPVRLVAAPRSAAARNGSCAPARWRASRRMLALEAGWVLTEVGRQPWVVYGFLRTADAVTKAPGIWGSFAIVVGDLRRCRDRRCCWSCAGCRGGGARRAKRTSTCPDRTRRAGRSRFRGPPGRRRPRGGRHDHDRRAHPLVLHHLLRRPRRRRLRRGVLGSDRRRRAAVAPGRALSSSTRWRRSGRPTTSG